MKKQPPSFTDQTIVAAVADQLTCDLAGEAAILKISSGVYYGLNPTGAFLWERLQEPIRIDDLRTALLNHFDVSEGDASRDLFALLEDLMQSNLIETRDALAS